MNEGWVKLHRELFEKAIWQGSTPEQKVILITLLGMANHQGKEWEWKGKQFKAESGQFITSIDSIIKKCGKGISSQNVRSAITKFKKYEFLTEEVTKTGRLVTIVNWGFYQGLEIEGNKATNKALTKRSQSTNKEVTTNKNDKNDKKIYSNELVEAYTTNEVLKKTLYEFIEARKKIKKPMSDVALKKLLNKLSNFEYEDKYKIEVLNTSIINGWAGIFELKNKPKTESKERTREILC